MLVAAAVVAGMKKLSLKMLSKHVLNCRYFGRQPRLNFSLAQQQLKDQRAVFFCSQPEVKKTENGSSADLAEETSSSGSRDGGRAASSDHQDQVIKRRSRYEKVQTQKAPFVKNLFLGRIGQEVFTYPQICNSEELEFVERLAKPVETFFKENVDSVSIDKNGKIPGAVLEQLKQLGVFGVEVPMEYGGFELNSTECVRFSEVTAADSSISMTLAAHQGLGIKTILLGGSEELQSKYLPKLATGEHIAAFCLAEPKCGSDITSLDTSAKLSEEGSNIFLLNGTKSWVVNGGIADIFIVVVRATFNNEQDKESLVPLLVEKDFGGITVSESDDKTGTRGCNTCTVHFNNTPVPIANSLGELGQGQEFVMDVLGCGHIGIGGATVASVKNLFASVVETVISREQFGKKLHESDSMKERIAKIAMKIYVIESMTYLTAGLRDTYHYPDTVLETAILKIFSSESAWQSVNDCLHIAGGISCLKNQSYDRCLRDTRMLAGFQGSNDVTRLFIALRGIQFAGQGLTGFLEALKDPLDNLTFFMKKKLSSMKYKGPEVEELLHPTFKEEAKQLTKDVVNFQGMVEAVLAKYRKNIVDQQMVLKRIADITIDFYAQTACLSRASRARSIGLRNNNMEVLMTKSFCFEAHRRINDNLNLIAEAIQKKNSDANYREIAETIFKDRGYSAEHPTTLMW